MRRLYLCLVVLLQVACSSTPVKAPVGTRDTTVPSTRSTHRDAAATAHRPRPVANGGPDSYLVKRGDTLYSIAWQHGLSSGELAALNAIRPPYTIYTGQRLRIRPDDKPVTGVAPRPAPLPAPTPIPATRPAAQPIAKPAPEPGTKPPAKPVAKSAAKPRPPAGMPEPVLPAVVKHWVWPTQGPLLDGYRADASGRKGIEIGGKSGQPVKAAAAGKVVYSGSGLVGYGRLIIIKHNESLLSAYGHNSKLLVSEGDYVKTGQAIATMGSSGTDHIHLYFEIRKNGRPVNPLSYLPGG